MDHPQWEKPQIVPLDDADSAAGDNACENGSSAFPAQCVNGTAGRQP